MPWQLKAAIIFLLTWQISFTVSNAGLLALLAFLYKLFQFLSKNSNEILQFFGMNFPKTRDAALKMIGIDKSAFIKYIVCPCCDACYSYYLVEESNQILKECKHIQFPNHPHESRRQPCGAYLMKIIKSSSDACTRVRPIKLFAYQSLKVAMTNLLNKDGFLKQCEQWRQREKTLPP